LTSCAIGNLLYVGGHPDIQILDISDPSNPILLGELDGLPWVPFDIKVQGALAYVVNRGGGFWIIDVRDPTSPEVVSGLEIFDYAWRLDIAGQYVYIADRYSGQLRIIDVSNPSIPWETSGLNIGPSLRDVASSGRYAYCLDAWNGMGGVGVSTSFNMIGGTEPGAGNLISGNGEMGIFIGGTEADMGQNNVIQGNFIGTDVTGTNAILNNVGVEIHTSNNLLAVGCCFVGVYSLDTARIA